MSQSDSAALNHPQLELAATLLRSGSTIKLRALGASMLPALWPGDLLTINAVPVRTIRAGEIVLSVRNGRFCIHRLLQVGSASGADWITGGDALTDSDPPVNAMAILGRVSSVARGQRVLDPRKRSVFGRMLVWILCRSELLCKLVLRIHSLRQRVWTRQGTPTAPPQFSPSQTAR